jgi:hypothetical protein
MGPEKVNDRQPSLLSRACRLPRKLADRVSELSDTLYREHLHPLKANREIPYKFLAISILLLMYLPSFLLLNYVVPPQVVITPGDEVSNTASFSAIQVPEVGVTNATLLNSTPFVPGNDWDLDAYFSYPDYDLNRYTRFESDGYHMTFKSNELTSVAFYRTMQVPIFNYSEISLSLQLEKVSGSVGIYLEAFADDKSAMVESSLETNQSIQLNVSAPLEAAKLASSSWLSTIVFRFDISSYDGGQVILRSAVIKAAFTTTLYRTQIDVQSTENESLFENPNMNYLESHLRIMLLRNNVSDLAAVYEPNRPNDELFLPPGIYEGMAFWHFFGSEDPDPNNATTWQPNVNFTVSEGKTLDVYIRLSVIRLDINISPNVLLRGIGIYFMGEYLYSVQQSIIGSTLFSSFPSYSSSILPYYYIPGGQGSLFVYLSTWSAFSPTLGWGGRDFHISTETFLDATNSSRNLQLSIVFPYVSVGNAVIGLGDLTLFAVEAMLLVGFAISMHRSLRHSDLRHRLADSRLLPIVLLGLGIILPWSTQLMSYQNHGYDVVYWISWFSMPLMILWTSGTPIQVLCSTADWWNASLLSTFFLFVPLFYMCLSLTSPETESFDRGFALALFLPYLVVLNGFNLAVLSLNSISIGPILVLAALPIWLVRIALRRLGVTR